MANEALHVGSVDAYYGDSHVLHGIGFALQAGRLLGLLGRNGAGKTTCMATIMGFLRPRRGTIALFGENVAGLAPEIIATRSAIARLAAARLATPAPAPRRRPQSAAGGAVSI